MVRNVYTIIDGMAGSCGKGKVISEFTKENNVKLAISNNMPNAGHTAIIDGKKHIFRTLPVSSTSPNTVLLLGAGTAIDMAVLEQEYEENKELLEGREIYAHPLIPLISEKHKAWERENIKSGTTFKGGGTAMADRMVRSANSDLKFFKGYKNIKVLDSLDYHKFVMKFLNDEKGLVLLEGSQGSDLSLHSSVHYPYVTSREVTVSRMLDDSEIAPGRLASSIMVIRPFPIRISNKIYDGSKIYSGPFGNGQELNWMKINIGAFLGIYPTEVTQKMINEWFGFLDFDYTEYTTVTNQKRRVFDIDLELLKKNVENNEPISCIYLNFFQHLCSEYENQKGNEINFGIDDCHMSVVEMIENATGIPVRRLGTGAECGEYIDLENSYGESLVRKRVA